MNKIINKLLLLKLSGKYAHFRKFYTNSSSSLTYYIPPRTTITGMLASILQIPRNEYYELFSEQNCSISLSINSNLKKHTECMNYLHEKWEKEGTHTQCRLELLTSVNDLIEYLIYFYHFDNETYNKIKTKIINNDFGYGIYLGQRQFKGYIKYIDEITAIVPLSQFDTLHSIILEKNVMELNNDIKTDNINIISDQMPINMIQLDDRTRTKKTISNIVYEKNGQVIYGKFSNGLKLNNDKIISFFEE